MPARRDHSAIAIGAAGHEDPDIAADVEDVFARIQRKAGVVMRFPRRFLAHKKLRSASYPWPGDNSSDHLVTAVSPPSDSCPLVQDCSEFAVIRCGLRRWNFAGDTVTINGSLTSPAGRR